MTAEVLIDKIEYQLTKEWKNAEALIKAIQKCIKEFDDDAPYKVLEEEDSSSGATLKVVF